MDLLHFIDTLHRTEEAYKNDRLAFVKRSFVDGQFDALTEISVKVNMVRIVGQDSSFRESDTFDGISGERFTIVYFD